MRGSEFNSIRIKGKHHELDTELDIIWKLGMRVREYTWGGGGQKIH
jgi:hypothetical protein